MINLFEYQNKVEVPKSMQDLEGFLDEVWNRREHNSYYAIPSDGKIESQRFLQFIHKSKELKSNKYVGVIHFEGNRINLLPKIFYDQAKSVSSNDINQIQNHILWWLSYCRKIKFPNYKSSMGSTKSDFFEVLIYLFSKYTRELLNTSIYQQYEEVNRELPYIKGRPNVNAYINDNLSRGNWHKLNCTYDAFVFDNEFNRIIKYVTTLLFGATASSENKKNLREILFILDEVSDVRASAEQCSRISFNPMFGAFETVRDYCQLFLTHCISFDYKNDLKLFAFLLPMEYVFEDFLFGFIDKEIDGVSAKSQRSDTFLDVQHAFRLKPDLELTTATKTFIADAKYKIVYSDDTDPKNGISQTDLYQMLAYAVRFKANEILLFYPNTLRQNQEEETELTIKDALADDTEILIRAFQLPIINRGLFEAESDNSVDLLDRFESTRVDLIQRLEAILLPSIEKGAMGNSL